MSYPEECLVGKYARPVIYYVAGWTLFSASKAATIAASNREIYFAFARAHKLQKDEAKSKKLPISQVERRKRKNAQVYSSKDYFEFIFFVETVYLANLTLKMMRAYADGDIVIQIKRSLLSNSVAIEKFDALCNNDSCESFSQEDRLKIMSYLMERYANMRGTFFVKHLKNNGNGNLVNKLAENQATRTKVANAVISAKAVADAKEQQLWEGAINNAFEYADRTE